MKISVVTPTVRPDAIEIVKKCLNRQTLKDFKWIVVSPKKFLPGIVVWDFAGMWMLEPSKKKGDYYNLNKAWNEAFRQSNGELIVSIVDGLWFPPDTLERLWYHYKMNPQACISTIGHQYDKIENGKPEHMVWADPRARVDLTSFYEVPHTEMELCVASFPRQAVLDVGGVDEEFDRYAALSEKEMMARMYKAGYTLWLDQTIEYRALYHPRLNSEWDERYQACWPYYEQCLKDIDAGNRLRLDFVK